MIATGQGILKYIPQREPVVMIDTLLHCEETFCTTSLKIVENNLFVETGVFTESGLLENMAQTGAAKVGYECEKLGKPVPPGFIGGIKNLEITQFPKVGDTIQTTIKIENEVFGITLISGEVMMEGQVIARAEMKIVLQTEPAV
jgi:3-hydroxymyristoyl/3-hydroxydecanoyl-(acyl carrier protein) dehydratase